MQRPKAGRGNSLTHGEKDLCLGLMLKRTPLYGAHQRLGAHLVEFGGWEMPLCSSGIIEEHLAVRSAAGLFDISHMGEFTARGAGALEFLNCALTNDARALRAGQGQYTILCNERGCAVDDLYLYRVEEGEYLMIVNASRIEADFAWLQKRLAAFAGGGTVELKNRSEELAAVAVQGPTVAGFIDPCFAAGAQKASALRKNQIGGSISPAARCWSPAPVTQGRMALRSWPRRGESKRCGTNCWRRGGGPG